MSDRGIHKHTSLRRVACTARLATGALSQTINRSSVTVTPRHTSNSHSCTRTALRPSATQQPSSSGQLPRLSHHYLRPCSTSVCPASPALQDGCHSESHCVPGPLVLCADHSLRGGRFLQGEVPPFTYLQHTYRQRMKAQKTWLEGLSWIRSHGLRWMRQVVWKRRGTLDHHHTMHRSSDAA